jgi:hypothetical protein
MEYTRFDLQLFADGGAGAGSGAGTGGAAGGDGGMAAAAGTEIAQAEQRSPARSKRRENPLANVTYGRQAEPAKQTDAAAQDQTEQQDTAESFEDLIKGRFKGDFESRVQGILQDRLKGSREREAKVAPILERIAQKYGMDTADMASLDLDALTEAIDSDASQYEQEAMEKGMDVETLMKVKKLERMEAVQQREAEQKRQQAEIEQHLQGMIRQGEEVKKLYPGFDLQAELQNPAFVRLTAPGVGVDVRTAYEVVHRDEMRGAEMQFAAQKSAQRIAASVQANGRRPAENGAQGGAAAMNKSDPTKLSKEDRAEIRRRVRNGEKIVF